MNKDQSWVMGNPDSWEMRINTWFLGRIKQAILGEYKVLDDVHYRSSIKLVRVTQGLFAIRLSSSLATGVSESTIYRYNHCLCLPSSYRYVHYLNILWVLQIATQVHHNQFGSSKLSRRETTTSTGWLVNHRAGWLCYLVGW